MTSDVKSHESYANLWSVDTGATGYDMFAVDTANFLATPMERIAKDPFLYRFAKAASEV